MQVSGGIKCNWIFSCHRSVIYTWIKRKTSKHALLVKIVSYNYVWQYIIHWLTNSSNHHWFRQWLGADQAPSYCLNQWWNIVNWTFRNNFHWNFNRNSKLFSQENAFENVVCEMAAILSRPQCVNINDIQYHRVTFLCTNSLWFTTWFPKHTGSFCVQ